MTHLRTAIRSNYDVEKLLGRGGMGAVFLAKDRDLDRSVAIKVLPPELHHDQNFVKRFEHEARTAAKLDHPNIIPIFAVEAKDDLHYFVMKYVTGRGLDRILESGALPVDLTQRILWESACALGHAHQRGIVHRDIKPANIMIDDAGRTMLADFGISKALESASQFTATGQVIGTPHYMSPEQAKGQEVDGRTDQYSLAVVGYRMVAGRLPFEDDSVHTIIYKQIFEDPPPLADFRKDAPAFLVNALTKALAKDPEQRYPTMEQFASAVWPDQPVATPSQPIPVARRSWVDGEATEVTPARGPKKRGRHLLAALYTVMFLAAGAGGVYWFTNGGAAVLQRGGQATTLAGGTAPDSEPTATTVVTAQPTTPPDTGAAAATPTARQTLDTSPAAQPPPVQPSDPPRRQTPRPQRQQPAPPVMGFLTIGASPYGRVFIDGVEIQDTPLVGHELRPGTYVIEIRREGYLSVVDTVVVTARNTARKNYTLTREP